MPDYVQTILSIDATTQRLHDKTQRSNPQRAVRDALARAMSAPGDIGVLSAMLRLGDADALQAYLAHAQLDPLHSHAHHRSGFGAEFQREVFTLADNGRIDLLDALVDSGFDLTGQTSALFHGLRRHTHTDVLPWIERRLARGRLASSDLESLIRYCGTRLDACYAGPLAKILKTYAENGALDTEVLHTAMFAKTDKVFFCLLRAGPKNIRVDKLSEDHFFRLPVEPSVHARRLEVAQLTTSAHGRLEIFRREPSLTDMLARPASEPFMAS